MKRIYKHHLKETENTFELPDTARVVAFQLQGDAPVIWFEMPDGGTLVNRTVRIVMTGEDIPDSYIYIGTIQKGTFVYHLYEVPKP